MDIFRRNGAKAIWKDTEKKQNRYVRFQTEFDADKKQDAKFYICADTEYELYINGKLVGFGQYDDFPENKVYDEYEISEYINEGKNLVSILSYSQGKNSFQHVSGLPMVIFTLVSDGECLLNSNETVKCDEALEFLSGEVENITWQRSYNFGFDLRNDDFWREKNVSACWGNSVVCDDSGISYSQREIKNLELYEVSCGEILTQGEFSVSGEGTVAQQMQFGALSYRRKDEVIEEKDGLIHILKDNVYWIADLKDMIAGYISIDIEAEDGAYLDIAYGEHLTDLRIRSRVEVGNFAFRCVCRQGRQKIRFYIKRLSGRYLQIFAHKGIKTIHSIGLHRAEYPLDFEESLSLSDRLFNKIYKVSEKTLRMCMHEHYEDCPHREQGLYAFDARNQMIMGYYAFGETKMARACLKLLGQSQRADGLLELTSPAHQGFTIPNFSLIWILSLKEYVLFTGDVEFIDEMFGIAKRILEFFCNDKKDGLIVRPRGEEYWNFYDWAEGMDNYCCDKNAFMIDAPLNCYYMIALKSYIDICDWSGRTVEKSWAQKEYDEISNNFHNMFFDKENGGYMTNVGENQEPHFAKLTQALALLSGCVPNEYREQIANNILSDKYIETCLSYLCFNYDALLQYSDKYTDFVLKDIEEKWGYMLYNGATTFWETLRGEKTDSLCHAWSSVPIYIFWRYVMGIYPKGLGFTEISITPLANSGLSGEGKLKTPKGIYSVTLKDGKTSIN